MTRMSTLNTVSIDDLYLPQMEAFSEIASLKDSEEIPGNMWEINADSGKGYYWFFPIDGVMAVNVLDFELFSDYAISYEAPDLFCIGRYNRHMLSYFFDPEHTTPSERIVGYTWQKGVFSEILRGGERLQVASIILLPKAIQNLSSRFECSPLALPTAIAELDGTQSVPGLSDVLESIFTFRPSRVSAKAFYRCKIIEAAALLVNWWHQKRTPGSQAAIKTSDREALDITDEFIRTHIESSISLEDLCRVSCMSASKLSGLFKKAEQCTPVEYVRTLKMDHACKLLVCSDASVGEIASKLGFVHQGSFSDAFKARYGISPRDYRKEYGRGHRIFHSQ